MKLSARLGLPYQKAWLGSARQKVGSDPTLLHRLTPVKSGPIKRTLEDKNVNLHTRYTNFKNDH